MRLWVRMVKGHKILRQATHECAFDEADDALTEVCRAFDIPKPLWLPKQEREYQAFRVTAFTHDNFLEDVPFDRLEIEFLDDGPKRKSADPRNQF